MAELPFPAGRDRRMARHPVVTGVSGCLAKAFAPTSGASTSCAAPSARRSWASSVQVFSLRPAPLPPPASAHPVPDYRPWPVPCLTTACPLSWLSRSWSWPWQARASWQGDFSFLGLTGTSAGIASRIRPLVPFLSPDGDLWTVPPCLSLPNSSSLASSFLMWLLDDPAQRGGHPCVRHSPSRPARRTASSPRSKVTLRSASWASSCMTNFLHHLCG